LQAGKVYLVGAGPGHPELLTVKAAELLRTGDVIVYDRLIQEEVLALAKPSAERIYMGKAEGRHDSRQDEILELLRRKSDEGKMVIRLKGGDPFVFGRGGEEAEYLAGHGVPFEVIPGVSAAFAAPECAGIAVTHRDIASSVAIVTGHEAGRESSRLNWDALAGIDTLVFLMGVRNTGLIARELLARGRDPATPAAMIQQAFWHGENVVTGTLATIADEVARAGVSPPATLVIGGVVALREKLKESQRDLRRRPDSNGAFAPAPAPDQLLRLATGGVASQVLRFALGASLFDDLEQWNSAAELAVSLRLNASAVAELLECLVSLGLVETGPAGFRNLELASRYLVTSSPHSLKPTLLYQASLGEPWIALTRYLEGDHYAQASVTAESFYEQSAECVARFAAPFALEKTDLAECSPVLIAGWGAETHRELALLRWPHLTVESLNPFTGGLDRDPIGALPHGQFGAILLSGLLESCERGQVAPMLETAASVLLPEGLLFLRDGFFPACAVSPPEVVLPALGRHVARGGCRNWPIDRLSQTLHALGFGSIRSDALPGGSLLVAARKRPANA
jgi:uroporphyrin-III C-methyltransferase